MIEKVGSAEKRYAEAMSKHRRRIGVVLVTVGYILSPASWWNDAFVNIPIAYIFAWAASKISPHLFLPVMVLAYWGTNVTGFLMMHIGATYILRKEIPKKDWNLRRTIIVTGIYTIIMVVLANLKVFHKPF